MPETVIQHAINLGFLAGLLLVSAGMGCLVLIKTRVRFAGFAELLIFSLNIGFGILSLSVFALCALQRLSPMAVYLLLSACAISAILGWRLSWASCRDASLPRHGIRGWDCGAGFLLLILLVGALVTVLTPAFGNDALSYHLGVPKLYLAGGGFAFIPGNLFSNYPLGGEMLFLIALVLNGDVLAKGIHFSMALLTLAAMWQFARQYLPESTPRVLPLLLFLSIPSVWVTATMAYTDLFLAADSFLAVYAYVNWSSRKQTAWLALCAVMTGLGAGSKYGGLFLPFLGCLAVLAADYRNRTRTSRTLIHLATFMLITLAVGGAFYLKNWSLTGNPLYPFFYRIFGGRGWDADQARRYDLFLHSLGMGRGWIDYFLLPWNISFYARMHSPQFDGVLGPTFILTLPFLAGIRKIPWTLKVLLVYAASTFLFWAVSAQQIRYLIPVFPPLAVAVGYIIGRFRHRKPLLALIGLFVCIGLCVNGYHLSGEYRSINPHRYVLGEEDRDTFLSRIIPAYPLFQYINAQLQPDAKIFLIYMKNLGFLCDRPYYSDAIFESHMLQAMLSRADSPEAVVHLLKRKQFTHILFDSLYVLGPLSTLSGKEIERFKAFQKEHTVLLAQHQDRYRLYALLDR